MKEYNEIIRHKVVRQRDELVLDNMYYVPVSVNGLVGTHWVRAIYDIPMIMMMDMGHIINFTIIQDDIDILESKIYYEQYENDDIDELIDNVPMNISYEEERDIIENENVYLMELN